MVTDYKHASKTVEQQATLPSWVWFVAGLFMGLFCAFLVFLQNQDTSVSTLSEEKIQLIGNNEVCNDMVPKLVNEPSRFEFYKTLPEREVHSIGQETNDNSVVPRVAKSEVQSRRVSKVNVSQAVAHHDNEFLLQAGSFRRYKDAGKRKASLALLGFVSKIHKVVINHNQVWHRVRIGPYASKGLADKTRVLLQRKKIETLLVRVRG